MVVVHMAVLLTVIVDMPFATDFEIIAGVAWCVDSSCLLGNTGYSISLWDAANPIPVNPLEWEEVVGRVPGVKMWDTSPAITYYRNTVTGDLRLRNPSVDTSMKRAVTAQVVYWPATLVCSTHIFGHAGSAYAPIDRRCCGNTRAATVY